MESQQEIKRQYLCKQILQQGYDPQDFGEYLVSVGNISDGNVDLNIWTFQQIQKIVSDFKQLRKKKINKQISQILPGQKQQSFKEEKQINEKKQPANLTEDLEETGKYEKINLQTKQQIFSQTINCQTAPPNSLLSADVYINVVKFQKRQGGMFQKSYVVYYINTPFLKKTVQRRYNDFVWLRDTLQKLHPGLPVPPIAKKGQFRRYDDKHLIKRLIILSMFLNKLLQIPEFKADQVLQNFLKFDDFVMFEKFKSQFRKMDQNINLTKIKSIKGKLNLGIDPKINNFLLNTQKNLNQNYLDIKRVFKEFKGAATSLEEAAQKLSEVSKVCLILDGKDRKFREQNEIKYQQNNIYTTLNEMSQKIADLLLKQAKCFRKEIYGLVKYQYLNSLNIMEAFDKLVQVKRQYQESKNYLMKKKQKLYEEGNMSKWGIPQFKGQKPPKTECIQMMLPKETNQVVKLRQIYALYNFQLYEELHRNYLRNNHYCAQNLQKIAQLNSRNNSESMIVWVDLLTKIMAMKEGKNIQNSNIFIKK